MTDWPTELDVAPLREWPGTLTAERIASPFRVSGLRPTLVLLRRELTMLAAEGTELLVAIDPSGFRLDGRPRAGAKAAHPGVVLSFTAPGLGRLAYPCDRFTEWQDNLRAIALALEALRKVDRYGVTTRGEQYRGFLALEAGTGGADEAIAVLRSVIPDSWTTMLGTDPDSLRFVIGQAKRAAHPDLGGDADAFHRVTVAERTLRDTGRLS